MKIIKPPHWEKINEIEGIKVFTAGSINMGKSEPWADKLANLFADYDVTFFNPLRDDWDSTWEQKLENDNFRGQVMWEIEHLLKSDITVFFIASEGESPISLLEIGLMSLMNATSKSKVIVCCEQGFWRRGNVEVMCYRFGMPLVETFEELVELLKTELDGL